MKSKILWLLFAVVMVGVLIMAFSGTKGPGKYDTFAQCLKDRGATFYGAFWCPHCQNQKAKFGKSAKLLPYVECSEPNGKDRTQVCIDKKIESYPTWEFKDASRLNGEVALETLAEKTGCTLPQ